METKSISISELGFIIAVLHCNKPTDALSSSHVYTEPKERRDIWTYSQCDKENCAVVFCHKMTSKPKPAKKRNRLTILNNNYDMR